LETKNRVTAADRPLFQLPFTCGQQWRGSTRSGHSPNTNSIDFFIVGDTTNGQPILASAAGRVTFAGWGNGGGWMVNIAHGGGWGSTYLHMLERPSVSDNQQVAQGQQIGRVGSTGDSSGPHLHYQQWKGNPSNTVRAAFNGVPVNIAVGTSQVLTSYNCEELPMEIVIDSDISTLTEGYLKRGQKVKLERFLQLMLRFDHNAARDAYAVRKEIAASKIREETMLGLLAKVMEVGGGNIDMAQIKTWLDELGQKALAAQEASPE